MLCIPPTHTRGLDVLCLHPIMSRVASHSSSVLFDDHSSIFAFDEPGRDMNLELDDHDGPVDAWNIQDDRSHDSDESRSEDFDMYRDFYNMDQVPKQEEAGLPPSSYGGVPPMAARPKSHPLVQIPTQYDPSASSYDIRHPNDSFLAGDDYKGHSTMFSRNDSFMELAPLGPEYTAEEHERMTRAFRRREHLRKQGRICGSWFRGESRCFGWFGRGPALILFFIFLAFLAVLLYFVVPRVPGTCPLTHIAEIDLVTHNALTAATKKTDMELTPTPMGFKMNGTLHFRVDYTNGWIPVHLLSLETHVKLTKTDKVIGQGNVPSQWIPGHKTSGLKVPISFSHKSVNQTGDETQLAVQDACAHLYQGVQRPSMDLRVRIKMDLGGIVSQHEKTLDLTNVACPWELPN